MSGTVQNLRVDEISPIRDSRITSFYCNGCGVYERIRNISTIAVFEFDLLYPTTSHARTYDSSFHTQFNRYSVIIHPYANCLHKSLDRTARRIASFRGTSRELSAHEEARILNAFKKAFEYELTKL